MDREAYERKIEALLPEWREKIAFMESRLAAIAPSKQGEYQAQLEQMREKHREASRLLGEYRAAPHTGWEQMYGLLSKAWDEMTGAYEKALCQFEGVKN